MKTLKYSLLLFTLATIVFLTCRNSKPHIIKVDPAYAKYVSGFTGGNIAKRGTIRIELAKPFSPKGSTWSQSDSLLPDSSVLNNIVRLDPSVKGKARWLSSRVIEFTPSAPLESGVLYTVSFQLDKVADVPEKYSEMQFQFKTWPQVLTVSVSGLQNYDQFHATLQYMQGTLRTTDEFDTSHFKKLVKAKQNGKKLPLRWEFTGNENEYYFYFDSIVRREKAGTVEFSWDGDPIEANQHGEQEIAVSALGDFRLDNANLKDNGDQRLELRFSDPIYPNQEFANYISINGSTAGLQFQCSTNLVTVYLTNRVRGNYTITVKKGLKNVAGAPMQNEQTREVEFLAPKPLARLHGHGSVLPNSQGLRIPLETINLKAVDIRVIKIYESNIHQFLQVNDLNGEDGLSRVGKIVFDKKVDLGIKDSASLNRWSKNVLDLGQLIKTDIGSIYRVSVKFKASYTGCGCEQEHEASGYYSEDEESEEAEDEDEDKGSYAQNIDYDYSYYSDDEQGYNDDADPCTNQYYQGKALNRNILASDLGIIAKTDGQRNSTIYVSNLISAKPTAGAQIEILDYTRQILGNAVTDAEGGAQIHSTGRPFLLVAKWGNQRGYLKLTPGTNNSMSRFETDGEIARNGMKGFLYGERGVWRPGDSIYLTFMLEPGNKPLPSNHPYKFELKGPEGQSVEEAEYHLKTGNMDVIRFATSPTAPTGNYTATVTVGNMKVSKTLSIETVKPNHLKILLDLPENGISENGKAHEIPMHVKWLHGANAGNLKTQVEMSLRPGKTVFPKFRNYNFESPLRNRFTFKSEAFNGNLDKDGNATIKTAWNGLKNAPGVLQASFTSRVYENSGDMNIDRSETQVYPFKNYIGVAGPGENKDQWLSSGKKHWFDVVSVDAGQKPVNAAGLRVAIYKIEWKWWYEQDEAMDENYLSRPATYLYKDTVIDASKGHSGFWFGISNQEWGRFLIVVTDPKGGHESGTIVNFDYPYWGRQNGLENDGASLLSLSTNKSEYLSGETAQITFPSSAGSRALVSVETSRKVVKTYWVNTTAGETRCSFACTPEMSPNAYVHITLIQPHLQTINDRPIRMYGVVPIMVLDPASKLKPVITSAAVFKPEQTETVMVSEASGRAMTYTLAIVDEGLLDLTHFQTPDPHKRFYAKEALGVKTWDIYDAVIGAYGGKMDRLLSIGGDGGFYDEESASKAKRFKPMVKFLGPFLLNAGAKAIHRIQIPNYVGSVRIMVVGRQDKSYGNAEKTAEVKQPLMVMGALPRVIGLGETIKIPVTVFAMEKQIRDVKVKFNFTGEAKLTGSNTQQIHFSQTGEEIVYFELKTNQSIGLLKVNIVATSGNLTTHDDIDLPIRATNPLESRNTDIQIRPGESAKVPVNWLGIKGSNSLSLTLSSLPVNGIQNRLDYLIEYPHGCIEQTTSAVFAQLYLGNIMNLNRDKRNAIEGNIKAALQKYKSFQTNDGGFAYWPGEKESSEWGSNYAGHFMLEAEKAGYFLPVGMKDQWIDYQKNVAKTWKYEDNPYVHPHGNESYELLQAYRLYLLALAGKPEIGAMNTMREKKTLSDAAAWRLSGAYALSGRKDVSRQLMHNLSWNVSSYRELGYTYGSVSRDKAMILECMSAMGLQAQAEPLFKEVSATINSDHWLSTQEAAYSLMAICTWANGGKMEAGNLSVVDSRGKSRLVPDKNAIASIFITENELNSGEYIQIKNNGKTPVYVREVFRGSPLAGQEINVNNGLEMRWYFTDKNNTDMQAESIPAGTDFTVKITLKNTSNLIYREMALKEILPAGWEIMDSRLFGESEMQARYANIKDDRVYYYFDLSPAEIKVFTLKLHAAYEGEYYLPGPYAEAMYDAGIRASAKGRNVKVTKAVPGA